MSFTHPSTVGDSDPLAGFVQMSGLRSMVYLLQVKTGSSRLDDALYGVAHPGAPDARPDMTHHDVVAAIREIASSNAIFGELASQLADDYAKEYCS